MQEESKPTVVTPTYQQQRSPSTFRGTPEEDPLKWLKEYDRVDKFNNWDDMIRGLDEGSRGFQTLYLWQAMEDEVDLVSLIRRIVQEEVHRVIDQTREPILYSDPYPQTQLLEEMVQDEVEKVLAPVSVNPAETQRRPTYAAVTRRSRVSAQRLPTHPRKAYLGEQLTTDQFVSTVDVLDMSYATAERGSRF
ncbi:retrotrans_gag domain-containing protein [Trichonephila clavata]|uniref:Retrotrans_gag domain-containing protein n=1 Tax=Trichonephila clavata TaxID=2740835 RepID=A0A8X6JQ61_TRICU|nr:retrotrans_gag domain-containing protein [Trichonephila clavata]